MPIPSYKKIIIKHEDIDDVFNQLSPNQYHLMPHLLSIKHLINQKLALTNILKFVEQKNIKSFPYCIYIETDIEIATRHCILIKDESLLPRFFIQKLKVPNIKETAILSKISLKQTNIKTLIFGDYTEGISQFGHGHKMLCKLADEGIFLEKVLKCLKKADDDKK